MNEPLSQAEPDSNGDEPRSLRQEGRDIAMEAILRTVFEGTSATEASKFADSTAVQGRTSGGKPNVTKDRTTEQPSIRTSHKSPHQFLLRLWSPGLITAATLFLAVSSFLWIRSRIEPESNMTTTMVPEGRRPPGLGAVLPPGPRSTQISPPPSMIRSDDPSPVVPTWEVVAEEGATYQTVDTNHITLQSGEIQVVGKQSDSAPLEVSTATGTVVASGAINLRIGHHPWNKANAMNTNLLRVLILAGTVTMTSSDGQMTGTAGQLLAAVPGEPPQNIAVTANNSFAFELYKQLAEKEGNLFFSPYSISAALSMTIEGAKGPTAEQMASVLQIPDQARPVGDSSQRIPMDFLALHTGHRDLSRLWNRDDGAAAPIREEVVSLRAELQKANAQVTELTRQEKYTEARRAASKAQSLADQINERLAKLDQFELRVANAIWGDKSYDFSPAYVKTIEEYYGTGAFHPMDFRMNGSKERVPINQWVGVKTNGMIPELLEERIMTEAQWQRVRLILTNAIYFRGEWSIPFEQSRTKPESFMTNGTDEKRVPLMHAPELEATYAAVEPDGSTFETPTDVPVVGDLPKCYPDDGGMTLLELSYKGGDLSMTFLLPRTNDGLKDAEKLVTAENLQSWLSKSEQREVKTWIPRFSLNEQTMLASTLKSMGMVNAFEEFGPNKADFSKIAASDDVKDSLFISEVVHSATIEVTEKGTEAAAATAVILANPRAMPATRPFTPDFRADHPFLFLIRDRKSGAILFMGRLSAP